MSGKQFKCRCCGEKKSVNDASDSDVALCRDCNPRTGGEEE